MDGCGVDIPLSGVMSSRRSRGMTLIEIMIVVSILAILAAIIVPRFSSAMDQAKVAHAVTTIRELANAANRYHAEHDAWPRDVARGTVPQELKPYLIGADFVNDVSGGKWDYENWIGKNIQLNDGRRIGIGISLRGGDQQYFTEIDRALDDGNLSTGNVQYGRFSSMCLLYLIAED